MYFVAQIVKMKLVITCYSNTRVIYIYELSHAHNQVAIMIVFLTLWPRPPAPSHSHGSTHTVPCQNSGISTNKST